MNENVVSLTRQSIPTSVLEGQLFGAILELPDPLTMFEIAGLSESDLSDKRVAVCWGAARRLAERSVGIVNADTVFSVVRTVFKDSALINDSTRDWLRGLQAENALTRESFAQVAGDLRRTLLGRAVAANLEAAARELRSGNFDVARIAADLDTANHSLLKADGQTETAARDVLDLDTSWSERERLGTSPLLPTGIKLFDETIKGFPPNLTVIAAQPGVGKNMALATIIRSQLESDPELQLGLFALEDGSRWLVRRWTAQDLKIPLNSVGSTKRTPEQLERLTELNPHYYALLERLQIYRFDDIRPDELVHQARGWIHRKKVRGVYIDHLGHLDHTARNFGGRRDFMQEKRNEAVATAVKKFASLAYREEVAFVALAHTGRPEGQKDEERPPRLSEIAESAGIERRIRCAIGLWRTAGRELRATILKNTEGPGVGITMELEQNREAATIDAVGGMYVNLEQEARQAKESRFDDNQALMDARRKNRAMKLAIDKADIAKALAEREEAAKPKSPQLTLLEPVPT